MEVNEALNILKSEAAYEEKLMAYISAYMEMTYKSLEPVEETK